MVSHLNRNTFRDTQALLRVPPPYARTRGTCAIPDPHTVGMLGASRPHPSTLTLPPQDPYLAATQMADIMRATCCYPSRSVPAHVSLSESPRDKMHHILPCREHAASPWNGPNIHV